jgi:sodium transport system permease protein
VTLPLVVFRKELRDHGREIRSVLSSLLMALLGPAVVLLVSMSERADGKPAVLLGMLSVFALVSSFAGATDIAMDATVGERERRSLLPLLLNPVERSAVIAGKWMAVTVFALAALTVNCVATVGVLMWTAPDVLTARLPLVLIWMALGLVPLAALGAAVSILVAVSCRTTKEAQNALKAVTFAPMLVGVFLVFFPSWTGQIWFLLPVAGQQALIGVPEGSIPVARAVLLAAVTLAAAVPVLLAATRVLTRDEVLSA